MTPTESTGAQLGTCDFKQYEHCGPHERITEIGGIRPPYGCKNWKPVAALKPSEGQATCPMSAGICSKPEFTYGEGHYCSRPDFHVGPHRCRRCEMDFNADGNFTFGDDGKNPERKRLSQLPAAVPSEGGTEPPRCAVCSQPIKGPEGSASCYGVHKATAPEGLEQQTCGKTMHMYVWSMPATFLAAVQAENVEAARTLLLEEIGSSGDGSCPEREDAAKHVQKLQPRIFHRANAEFAQTDSSVLREVEAENEKLRTALAQSEGRVAKAREEAAKRLESIAEMPVNTKEQNDILRYAAENLRSRI